MSNEIWKSIPGYKKFQAQIRIKGKCIHLGYFDNECDAHKAYILYKEKNKII